MKLNFIEANATFAPTVHPIILAMKLKALGVKPQKRRSHESWKKLLEKMVQMDAKGRKPEKEPSLAL